MSDPSIHIIDVTKLPEIWLEIFGYLSHDDLLTSTEVCNSWNEIISSSRNFTSKTNLRIEENRDITTFKITRSSYESLSLKLPCNEASENRQLLSQLMHTAHRLRYINFYGEFFGVDVINFLQHCSQLKELEISGCKFVGSYDVNSTVELNLDHLHILHISENYEWILDHLDCRSVKKTIDISSSDVDYKSDGTVHFLNKVEGEVDTLIIDEIDLDKSSVEFFPKFKWRTLRIDALNANKIFAQTMPNKQKLFDAALPNATLKLDYFDQGNLQIFNAIANAKNVTSLFMNSELFDGILTQDQADALPDIDHVEILSIQSQEKPTTRADLSPYLEPFLNKLTKLNSLMMDAILLENLSMERFQPYQLNLKSLHLWTYDTQFFIGDFVSEFLQQLVLPKIETLKISELTQTEFLSDEFLQILTIFGQNNPSLKKLSITPNYHPHFILSDVVLQKILLNAFAAMPSVQFIKVKYCERRFFGGMREDIYEKYFGSDEAARATVTILR